ncbi:hypothetical protein Pmani_031035 [Petrolisthes manimaculis]|uniref:DDRGK domain-containing protein 1 n=1 Tax=Petrolisthes manimaculis TaxID=1843537 RepID=A0AAE1NUF5_9EUCA|nr:hypothetical protein Pmani_031035 [Petrolisthes manimaculis]
MSDVVIYTVLVGLVTIVLAIVLYLKQKGSSGKDEDGAQVPQGARPRVGGAGGGGAAPIPNRAIAQRNARARMRAAAQRHREEESEDEVEELGDEIALPEGKIGKKKLAKLQAKAERRVMREAEEREREEKKEQQEKETEERKVVEEKEAQEAALKEEQEKKEREERERREQEEYEMMKASFEVEETGFEDTTDETKEQDLLNQFVNYIKAEKVVVLEELAAKFKIKTQDAIKRVTTLQEDGTLSGVIDDRGKFIYISRKELESVAKFIRQRGRVSIYEIVEASASLITLTPDRETQEGDSREP